MGQVACAEGTVDDEALRRERFRGDLALDEGEEKEKLTLPLFLFKGNANYVSITVSKTPSNSTFIFPFAVFSTGF